MAQAMLTDEKYKASVMMNYNNNSIKPPVQNTIELPPLPPLPPSMLSSHPIYPPPPPTTEVSNEMDAIMKLIENNTAPPLPPGSEAPPLPPPQIETAPIPPPTLTLPDEPPTSYITSKEPIQYDNTEGEEEEDEIKKEKKKPKNPSQKCLLKYVKDHPDALPPFRATPKSAGADISLMFDLVIQPRQLISINSGLKFQIPKNHVGQLMVRSSHVSKGLEIKAGTIDEDYRGCVIIVMFNSTYDTPIKLFRGEAVAQLVCIKISYPIITQVQYLNPTERGEKGFGSTNRKRKPSTDTDSNKKLKSNE